MRSCDAAELWNIEQWKCACRAMWVHWNCSLDWSAAGHCPSLYRCTVWHTARQARRYWIFTWTVEQFTCMLHCLFTRDVRSCCSAQCVSINKYCETKSLLPATKRSETEKMCVYINGQVLCKHVLEAVIRLFTTVLMRPNYHYLFKKLKKCWRSNKKMTICGLSKQ